MTTEITIFSLLKDVALIAGPTWYLSHIIGKLSSSQKNLETDSSQIKEDIKAAKVEFKENVSGVKDSILREMNIRMDQLRESAEIQRQSSTEAHASTARTITEIKVKVSEIEHEVSRLAILSSELSSVKGRLEVVALDVEELKKSKRRSRAA